MSDAGTYGGTVRYKQKDHIALCRVVIRKFRTTTRHSVMADPINRGFFPESGCEQGRP